MVMYFSISQTEIYGLMKNFAVLSYLTNRDIWSDEEFSVLSYLTNRDILSDEEFYCIFLS